MNTTTAPRQASRADRPTSYDASRVSRLPILRRQLADGRRALVAWSVAVVAVLAMYLPVYPSLCSPELMQMLESFPADFIAVLGFDRITTGAGYTQASFFGLLGFALAAIAATAWGARFIAGAEETGRLELTLAHAVGRVQYAAESAATLIIRLAVLGVVTAAGLALLNAPAELELTARNVAAVTLAWVSLAVVSGAASLATGACTGRHSWALGVGGGVALLAYALDAVGKTATQLDWLAKASPYYWAFGNEPLRNGFDWGGLALLWGLSAALVALSCAALARRDIGG
ncbi:ABC transporter permease subunit [Actinomyces sp. MRS3W]|uniref:ABC transporter permease subunit n=1 Tax=Actinomyces sp. MRS3W TaxID=2800796 RepID=UPI0028FD1825|nr:ABC transporter permease subunit [Actinomyces sp. MRS3W]MDU0349361.1 ABC transporter permease [Actinomyces sp. MRS3W]